MTISLTILETSDLHANIYPYNYFSGQIAEQGLAKVATIIHQQRSQHPQTTLLIDCGDTIQGTPLGTYYGSVNTISPHPMALGMNHLNYDLMILGNHDFNYGLTVLRDFIADVQFPVLSANIQFQDGTEAFRPYTIKPLLGIQVGILGLTTPRIDVWERPEHILGLKFESIIETAQHYIPHLKAQGADVIIAAIHSGIDRLPPDHKPLDHQGDRWASDLKTWISNGSLIGENVAIQLAEQVPAIDVILSGHTHQPIPELWVNGVLITQPHCFGRHVAQVSLTLEGPPWVIKTKQSQLWPVANIEPDPAIILMTAPYHQQTLKYLDQPIGLATAAFPAGPQARYYHSPLAYLINLAQIEAAAAAGIHVDLSLASLCTQGDGLPPGPIRLRDAYGISIFDNVLCVLKITGKILKQALEKTAEYFCQVSLNQLPSQAEAVLAPGARPYNWDLYAGIDYTIDISQPVGQRITQLQYQGVPVTPDQTFQLVVNHYRAQGGGNYLMFQAAPLIWKSTELVRDQIVRYIQAQPQLDPEQFQPRNFTLIPDLRSIYYEPEPQQIKI